MRRESGINEREHEIDHDPVLFEAEPTEETGDETTAIRALIDLDTIQTILENGWVNATVCRGDYSRGGDGERRSPNRHLPNGPISPIAPLNELKTTDPKTAWVDQKADGRQVVTLYWGHTSYAISVDLRKAMYTFGDTRPDVCNAEHDRFELEGDTTQEIDLSTDDLEGRF